jgi:hypothetical protein
MSRGVLGAPPSRGITGDYRITNATLPIALRSINSRIAFA